MISVVINNLKFMIILILIQKLILTVKIFTNDLHKTLMLDWEMIMILKDSQVYKKIKNKNKWLKNQP